MITLIWSEFLLKYSVKPLFVVLLCGLCVFGIASEKTEAQEKTQEMWFYKPIYDQMTEKFESEQISLFFNDHNNSLSFDCPKKSFGRWQAKAYLISLWPFNVEIECGHGNCWRETSVRIMFDGENKPQVRTSLWVSDSLKHAGLGFGLYHKAIKHNSMKIELRFATHGTEVFTLPLKSLSDAVSQCRSVSGNSVKMNKKGNTGNNALPY